MNPYDFARIDWNRPPERRRPVWHHRLVDQQGQRLYTGSLDIDIYAETPLFIADPRSNALDLRKPAQSSKNKQEEFILPGSSLKGMIRNVVETLGNGCLTLFDGRYERGRINYSLERPETKAFLHCRENTKLCIACRIFGMLKEGSQGVFLGKVNIGDACVYAEKIQLYKPLYTLALMEPKPHHASFYLDESRQHISGRKYYFHHSPDQEPLTENKQIYMAGKPANRYIQPLDCDTQFHARVDFTNLEADEFAALLLALTLEKDMRHKLGYGKPMGMGSICITPTHLTLIDYTTRYKRSGERGITTKSAEDLWSYIDKQLIPFYEKDLLQVAMDDLRRIWRWPPDPKADYYYPSKRDWFDTEESIGKRIADTKNVL
jgi:hypothetical protein